MCSEIDEETAPLIPITTGNIDKPSVCEIFMLFLSSDSDTVIEIYSDLYSEFFKNNREEYWVRETREVGLNDAQISEIFRNDDPSHDFVNIASSNILIGLWLCTSNDLNFGSKVESLLDDNYSSLDYYICTNKQVVSSQGMKFFKEFNKEDKGHKIN